MSKLPPINAGLGSILSSSTVTNKTSLNSIIKDVKKSASGMTDVQKRNISKTIHKMNTNPNAVVTNAMTKDVVSAMASSGHLKSRYGGNFGAAIAMVKKSHAATEDVDTTDPKKMSPGQRKEWKKKEKIRKAHLKQRAKEERVEAEGLPGQKDIDNPYDGEGHTEGLTKKEDSRAISEQSFEHKKRKGARTTIGAMISDKDKHAKSEDVDVLANPEDDPKDSWQDKDELVDMEIG
jgi:hypothetical protein